MYSKFLGWGYKRLIKKYRYRIVKEINARIDIPGMTELQEARAINLIIEVIGNAIGGDFKYKGRLK
jgi:hypothetical protein